MANYLFKVDRGDPYFKLAPSGRPLVVRVESYQNRDWKRFSKVVVLGNWFPVGEELEVVEFDPVLARAHHEVIKSLQVNSGAINRAAKARLSYTGLLPPKGRRPLTTEEIADVEVGDSPGGLLVVLEVHPPEAGPSESQCRSFHLLEGRFRQGSQALSFEGLISLEDSESG